MKITKAMKMIAAIKMKKEQERLRIGGQFGIGTTLLNDGPFRDTYAYPEINSTNKSLLVPITTDRGLCGGLNGTIVRELGRIIKDREEDFNIVCVGDKGVAPLKRIAGPLMVATVGKVPVPFAWYNVAAISNILSEQADLQNCGTITIMYNHFVNAISYQITRVELLSYTKWVELHQHNFSFRLYSGPDAKELGWSGNYEFYLASALWRAMLNNMASEQSSRMNAMENANKNCNELQIKLTLEYNKARQAKITKELCEIVSGAEAL